MSRAGPWIIAAAITGGFLLAMPIASLAVGSQAALVAEHGPAESMQLGAWLVAAGLAWTLAATGAMRPDARGRWLLVSIGTLALLAGLRESDVMQGLHPDRFGDWGVRFITSWWVSGDSPVLPRLMWGAVILVIAASVAVPILWSRVRPLRELRSGDPGFCLLAVTFGFGVAAVAIEKMLGDLGTDWAVQILVAEELLETVGAGTYIGAVLGIARPPDRV